MRPLARFLAQPLSDYRDAVSACLGARPAHYAAVVGAFALSWWLYVPVHELAHAWGCLLAGGQVTRLEIDWIYGASLLARVFPFVAVGSAYAGQLTGFDTHGSDLVYLATVAAPFVLTPLIGVPLLRAATRRRLGAWVRAVVLGASVPIAYAPFVSLTGDYYEMGSILVSRAVAAWSSAFPLARWRADDVFRLAGELWARPDGGLADAAGVAASLLVGAALAWGTYWAGVLVARATTEDGGSERA